MTRTLPTLPRADLDHVVQRASRAWDQLRGQHIFISGASGFIGTWLLESLLRANCELDLKCEATVLSRHPDRWRERLPHLAGAKELHVLEGDVRSFKLPSSRFSHIVHGATTTAADTDPLDLLETILLGTRRMLELARASGAGRFLLLSSGAVYGRQPPEVERIEEGFGGAPELLAARSAYGEGKRTAELLCALHAERFGLGATIARCFAFVGPHLPLDAHFAIGNFLRDGLRGVTVQVRGDGTPYRSHLHAADLTVWLWRILCDGTPGRAYNVGSEEAHSILEVARLVAAHFGVEVAVARPAAAGLPAERYVPATARARHELGLDQWISLDDAIERTACWYR